MKQILVSVLLCLVVTEGVVYEFSKYSYKKKRDDKIYRRRYSICENGDECKGQVSVVQVACIRRCISPICYEELYEHDPLEEGEIDVRLSSFKGCLHKNPES